MKPKVVTLHVLVEPRSAGEDDDPWTENDFGCAIEDAVDEFRQRLSRHGLRLLSYSNGEGACLDLYVDHEPGRKYPSVHSLLKKPT